MIFGSRQISFACQKFGVFRFERLRLSVNILSLVVQLGYCPVLWSGGCRSSLLSVVGVALFALCSLLDEASALVNHRIWYQAMRDGC